MELTKEATLNPFPFVGTVLSVLFLPFQPMAAATALVALINLMLPSSRNTKYRKALLSICIVVFAIQSIVMLTLFTSYYTLSAAPVS